MTPKEYLRNLQIETGKTLKQISSEANIVYGSLVNISEGNVNSLSPALIEKLAKYQGIPAYFVKYKLLADKAVIPYCSEEALLHLAIISTDKKYSSNVVEYKKSNKYNIVFDGSYYLTRNKRDYTLVDSWQNLKKAYWKEYFGSENDTYSPAKLKQCFNSESSAIKAVFFYGLSKVYSIKKESNKIESYEIIFKPDEEKDRLFLYENIWFESHFFIKFTNITAPAQLKYSYLFPIDNEVEIFSDLYWFCIEQEKAEYSAFKDVSMLDLKLEQYLAMRRIIYYLDGNTQKEHLALLAIYGAYRMRSKPQYNNCEYLRKLLSNYIDKVILDLVQGISDKCPLDTNLAAIKYIFFQYIDLFDEDLIQDIRNDMSKLIDIYNKYKSNSDNNS